MATVLTDDNPMTYLSFPIVKVDKTPDGDLLVWGKATDGTVDADQQIVDPAWSGQALEKWLSTGGNVRVMHSAAHLPAGKGVELDRSDGDAGHWVRSLVVEPTAKLLVEKGVLQAYSIGIANPRIVRDPVAKGGRIVGGEVHELSLVDRPANKNCGITLVKGATEVAEWFGDPAAFLTKGDKPKPDDEDEPDLDMTEDELDDEPEGADDEGDDTEPEAESDTEAEPTKKYQTERAEWLAREPKPAGDVGTGTAFLAKMATRQAWTRWDAEGEQRGLDGTAEGYARWLAKRDVRPEVGGGVDVDKLPDSDFIDPKGRRFPIVKPGDVPDAVSSFGRADPPIPMPRFRSRLTAIAHRKGPAFVAALPESWSEADKAAAAPDLFGNDEATKNIGLAAPLDTGFVPFNLQGQQDRRPAVKGVKACKRCGAEHHADSKMRRCDKCGKKLPRAEDAVVKGKGRRMLPADVAGAARHREPDGSQVEDFEDDAGIQEPGEAPETPDKIPASVMKTDMPADLDDDPDDDEDEVKPGGKKGKPFPGAAPPFGAKKGATVYQVRRMHDATCAAYDWDAVADRYPSLKGVADAVVPAWFGERVTAAVTKGDMARVARLAQLAADADVIAKGEIDPAVLADGRAELHKAFADMYPTTTVHPSEVTPGRFQRPYISAGHAPLSAGAGSAASAVPPTSHVPHPDDFTRPLITAGHEAESPGDRGDNLDTGGTLASGASRTFYRNASREAARSAMQAMHDHISTTFPDMCPMAASKAAVPPDMAADARPVPVKPPAMGHAPGEKAAGLTRKDITMAVKSAVAQATTDMAAMYQQQIAALQAEIEDMGAQPDPAQAPLRGAVTKSAQTTDEPAPVGPTSLIEKAQAAAATELIEQVKFVSKFLNHPSPQMAEQAQAELRRLLTAS